MPNSSTTDSIISISYWSFHKQLRFSWFFTTGRRLMCQKICQRWVSQSIYFECETELPRNWIELSVSKTSETFENKKFRLFIREKTHSSEIYHARYNTETFEKLLNNLSYIHIKFKGNISIKGCFRESFE